MLLFYTEHKTYIKICIGLHFEDIGYYKLYEIFYDPACNGDSVASTSELSTPIILVLYKVGNYNVMEWVCLQW
jgi:hypothetical protein